MHRALLPTCWPAVAGTSSASTRTWRIMLGEFARLGEAERIVSYRPVLLCRRRPRYSGEPPALSRDGTVYRGEFSGELRSASAVHAVAADVSLSAV